MAVRRRIGRCLVSALMFAPISGMAVRAQAQTGATRPAESFLDRPARIRVYNTPLLEALRDLERRSGVALAYSPSLLPGRIRVTCACDTLTVRDALRVMLSRTAFEFREADGQVLLFPITTDAVARLPVVSRDSAPSRATISANPTPIGEGRLLRPDSTTITGTVTTDAGTPIGSAFVSLPALRRSTTTSDAGTYRFVIPLDRLMTRAETLHVLRLGFRPAEIAFSIAPGDVTVDVAMATQVVALDQVVVTGTAGNQERGAQAALVASVDAAEITEKTPVRNVNELLHGRVSGVSMTTASGTSGANTRIDIRGQASVSLSNYPLVFVDGVRVISGPRSVAQAPGGASFGAGGQQFNALNDLNPDDIESIEIVKGPAGATLYGADASAGVIQILTKKGRVGVRRFSTRATTEYDDIDPNFTPFDNYGRCTALLVVPSSANPFCRNQTVGSVVSDNVLRRNDAFNHGAGGALSYSVDGGGDTYGYYGSFSAANERGTTLGSFLNHRTGRVSFNVVASPKLTLDASIGVVRADDRLPQGDQSSYGYLIGGDFGSPLTVTTARDGALGGGWFNNNLSVRAIGAIVTEDNTLRSTPSVQLRYSPAPWFVNRLTIGGDLARTTLFQMFPKNDSGWYSPIANSGSVSVTESNTTLYTVDYLGNINRRFGRGGANSSDLSFGSQWINTLSTAVSGSGQGLLTNSSDLISGATTTTAGESYGQTKSLGFIAQEQVGFDSRLYVQIGARLDRNSAFGSKVGSFFLPKAGVSYVLSQESFWRRFAELIPTFRLRAAYGTTGRSPSGAAALQTYSRSNYVTDGGLVLPGVSPGNPGNPNLRPERGTEFEGGVDAGFLHDRVGLELTYFNKTSTNLLFTQPIAVSSGFTAGPLVNIGEVVNRGLEVSVRATAIDRKDVGFDVGLNLNTLVNKIVSMGNIPPFVTTNNQCFKPGVEIAAWCVPRVSSVDTIAHRSIVSDTAQLAGGQLPKVTGSINGTLTLFHSLHISTQLDGKFAYYLWNATRDFRDRTVSPPNSADVNLPSDQGGYSAYERQRRLGPFYAQSSGASVGAALVRGPYIVPGDFVRLREVSMTWSLPSRLLRALHLESSAISVGGRNLALWTRYDGWDPEVIGGPDVTTPFLADVFTIPQSRRVFARLNVQY
jgi:TonB-linked SusC/RagA family outer membrane protein